MKKYKIGDVIKYTNGNPTILKGKIMNINKDYLSVLDHENESTVTLFNAGFSVTSHIHISQAL